MLQPDKINAPQVNRLDDNEAIYFGTELTAIKQKSYDKLYPELMARNIFPISYDAGPGAETIKYYQFDQVGLAKVVSNYGKTDFPRADIKGKEFISNVKGLGASFAYNVQEIRQSQMVGRPLPERRANAARRSILFLENQIAFFGDDANGLNGLLLDANVPNNAATADGASASMAWVDKTPDQIIRDVNLALRTINDLTMGVESADTVLLPIAQFQLIASTPRSSISDTTILTFLKGVHPGVTFSWLPFELKGTGTGSSDQMVCYRRDPDKLTMEIPQEYEQFDPQLEGMEYEVPVHERFGGVIIYYPLSISKTYGI